eukprot:gb/GECH01008195.1/.p1 GENE.gb/GECH01008195.1/~~gb/GECH01008195.1/.p1  ORF type:complete len:380 (+),score=87.64 gb/GECH01008195.1/:1-1140(+)
MFLYSMPFLIVNMGGEMIYILNQRLKAQNVSSQKSVRVLCDVIREMFSETLIDELVKPSTIYSLSSVRQIFDRLAHSSVMKLSTHSMDKLFDLMLMGAKYQFISSISAENILNVTLNHTCTIKSLIDDGEVMSIVQKSEEKIISLFLSFSQGEKEMLRKSLCNFFQDKRIKISMFMNHGLQSSDGLLRLQSEWVLPTGYLNPGEIKYYKEDGSISFKTEISHPVSKNVSNSSDTKSSEEHLGLDMYTGEFFERAKLVVNEQNHSSYIVEQKNEHDNEKSHNAMMELNHLSKLIKPSKSTHDTFKFDLFPKQPKAPEKDDSNKGENTIDIQVVKYGKEKVRQPDRDLLKIMDQMEKDSQDDEPNKKSNTSNEELLELMEQ